jgi:hypothetical protein
VQWVRPKQRVRPHRKHGTVGRAVAPECLRHPIRDNLDLQHNELATPELATPELAARGLAARAPLRSSDACDSPVISPSPSSWVRSQQFLLRKSRRTAKWAIHASRAKGRQPTFPITGITQLWSYAKTATDQRRISTASSNSLYTPRRVPRNQPAPDLQVCRNSVPRRWTGAPPSTFPDPLPPARLPRPDPPVRRPEPYPPSRTSTRFTPGR